MGEDSMRLSEVLKVIERDSTLSFRMFLPPALCRRINIGEGEVSEILEELSKMGFLEAIEFIDGDKAYRLKKLNPAKRLLLKMKLRIKEALT